jgi:hypothetical protein
MLGARRQSVIWFIRLLAACSLLAAMAASSAWAQKGAPSSGSGSGSGGSRGGPVGGGVYGRLYPPPLQPVPGTGPNTMPGEIVPTPDTLQKPAAIVDESCFPWEIPDARGATVSATRLAVPSSARSQYDKACNSYKKKKLTDAEQHARDAIQKYSNYSAAWVMLGQVLQDEQKSSDAHVACSHPITVEPAYLPPYLCLAGLLDHERNWSDLVSLTDRFVGLNLTGDMYAYYYRALAQFHLQNLSEAKNSILKAIDIDTEHRQPALNFLLAQIYGQLGDLPDATAQIQQYLKYSNSRQEKDAAREYLAELQSQQKPKE